jgi:hypothetical protein
MPPELTPELLARVVGRTLEDAAFVFTEVSASPPPHRGTVVVARMSFSGSIRGEFVLAAGPALGQALAANLLGEEPDEGEPSGRAADAVGELLNICCGVLAGELFGPRAVCGLGLPAVSEVPSADYEGEYGKMACRVSLVTEEGGRLDAALLAAGVPEGV